MPKQPLEKDTLNLAHWRSRNAPTTDRFNIYGTFVHVTPNI